MDPLIKKIATNINQRPLTKENLKPIATPIRRIQIDIIIPILFDEIGFSTFWVIKYLSRRIGGAGLFMNIDSRNNDDEIRTRSPVIIITLLILIVTFHLPFNLLSESILT